MSNIAFIFPGQGTQFPGMGKDFYDKIEDSRRIYEKACDILDMDVKHLCFYGNDQLNITKYTQIAMFVTEMAMLEAMSGIVTPMVCAGLSLGEYCAVVKSGAIDFETALKLVCFRGTYMQEAMPVGGAMSAIIGIGADIIQEVCEAADGIAEIANYNFPEQTVITGEADAVKKAGDELKRRGAKLVLPLNVSGPFHSSLLKEAGKKLGTCMKDITLNEIKIPYVSNTTAELVKQKEEVKGLLERQVSSPVCWMQSIRKMIEMGTDTFLEIGPGKTLSGFMRKIDKNVKTIRINQIEDLEQLNEFKG